MSDTESEAREDAAYAEYESELRAEIESEIRAEATNTGKPFERQVADLYRALGARRVEHDKEIAGHQIDVYVEFDLPDGSTHRIAVEAKDYSKPVGIPLVRDFRTVARSLRDMGKIEGGVMVGVLGFTRPARNHAKELPWLRLIEPADLKKGRFDYSRLEGTYDHYQLDGRKVEGNQSDITFVSPNILSIVTRSERGHNWNGNVAMNGLDPPSGTGTFGYTYPDRESWGTINIQVKENYKDLLVESIHREVEARISYIMRRID